MKLNQDSSRRVVLESPALQWVDSSLPGIKRKLLEHHGDEFSRSTSFLRYGPNTQFEPQDNVSGQEILVLEGVYEDDAGSYTAGTYIKNPPGLSHATGSESGCTLFVKNNYLTLDDTQRTVIDTRNADWFQGLVSGLTVLPLAEIGTKHTALVRWAPETRFNPHRHYGGEEILVLEGVFEDEFGRYPEGTWIRSPHMSGHHPFSIEGCLILVMTGHLLD
ncbi:ChrR cupin-like domain protein [mine drainage metagenome]|uniref:ChrR cupin-like domain protein n=1 Tax=mine drainage metagenome TaxID=410659 RepID=A0A1J5SM94_9ZZZZ